MRSLTHLALLGAALTTPVKGSPTLRFRAPLDFDLPDSLTEITDKVVGIAVDGATKFISSIPLSDFGEMPAVTLEDALEDPDLVDSVGLAAPLPSGEAAAEVRGDFLVSARQMNASASNVCNANSTGVRVEWRDYPDADKLAFMDSIACLMNTPSAGPAYAPSTSRYEDFVRTHQVLVSSIHGDGLFLLWHRYFLHAFETALRTQCGFHGAMPWWDETLDNGAFHLAPLFTNEYFGSLPAPVGGNGVCITDGKFANLTCHIGPGASNVAHCLSRAVNETLTEQASESYINYCKVRTEFGSFSSCAESGPHAWAHNGIGSVMAEVSGSPSDPVFFMHHSFVDHQLSDWQEINSTRKAIADGACGDNYSPCSVMTLDTVLEMNGLLPDVTVGDVLDTQGGLLCYTYDRFY